MEELTSVDGLSPLDQIRQAEAEITRRIIAAHEASECAITEARSQAALLKRQAHETGTRGGQIRYKEIIFKAEEEARSLVEYAHNQASSLQRKGQVCMEAAIQEAANIILGVKGGGSFDEP